MGILCPQMLTKAGRKILAQAQTGLPLRFTRAAAGDGLLPAGTDIDDMADLAHYVMDLPINGNKIVGDGTTKLELFLQNKGLTAIFDLSELGIFAKDNDDDSEVMYSYSHSGNSPAAYIPAGNGPNPVNLRIDVYTVIKQAEHVIVDITEGWGLVTHEEWNEFKLDLFAPYENTASYIWTADTSKLETLRRMPIADLMKILFGNISPDGEPVLLGYNPVGDNIFGYPISGLITRAYRLFGGSPSMDITDYTDGNLFGGNPSMPATDYHDGNLSGVGPFTF